MYKIVSILEITDILMYKIVSILEITYTHVQNCIHLKCELPCRVGSVGSVSASRTVGREFASRPGHTKDHHKNVTNCLPA